MPSPLYTEAAYGIKKINIFLTKHLTIGKVSVIISERFRKGETLGEIRDYFGRVLYTAQAPEDGLLLYQCASLNILEKGPMVSYGVPRDDP